MARAAVLGRLTWRVGTVAELRDESAYARTIVLDVPGWPGHVAGQHVDVRLTAPDGYSAQRSYSIASAGPGERVELTVEVVTDGEVSPYLAQDLLVGDQVELRGPIGGWFVWEPTAVSPVLLVAGGSGIVPLMAMLRARSLAASATPFRLLYSVRDPGSIFYRDELHRMEQEGVEITYVYTRTAPAGWTGRVGRIDAQSLMAAAWPAAADPALFVCGPTGFVETVADHFVGAGYPPAQIKTERFGPSGSPR